MGCKPLIAMLQSLCLPRGKLYMTGSVVGSTYLLQQASLPVS